MKRVPQRNMLFALTTTYGVCLLVLSAGILEASFRSPLPSQDLEPVSECTALNDCPGQTTCVTGKCLPLATEGGSCDQVGCGAGLVCNNNLVCASEDAPNEPPFECQDPLVQDALTLMIEECKSRTQEKLNSIDLVEGCAADKVNELIIDSRKFEILLKAYHESIITVKLPDRAAFKKNKKNTNWTVELQRGIQTELAPYRAELKGAKFFFVIGRMSAQEQGDRYERATVILRVDSVRAAVAEVLGEVDAERGYDVKHWLLSPEKSRIHPDQADLIFRKRIGHSQETTAAFLDPSAVGASSLLNTVHIIPIPCTIIQKLTEAT